MRQPWASINTENHIADDIHHERYGSARSSLQRPHATITAQGWW